MVGQNGQSKSSHPFEHLKNLATKWNLDVYSDEFALMLDERNVWPHQRNKFFYPKIKDLPDSDLRIVKNPESECIYFVGNSLGLQPKQCRDYINIELEKWAKM